MTRLCYLYDVPLLTVRGKTACPQCGTSYPFLPAVEPTVSAPAQLPRRAQSSPSAGGFYSQNLAQDRGQTGGLSGTCHGRNIEPYDAPPVTLHFSARKQAARADAAPRRSLQVASARQQTGDVR